MNGLMCTRPSLAPPPPRAVWRSHVCCGCAVELLGQSALPECLVDAMMGLVQATEDSEPGYIR